MSKRLPQINSLLAAELSQIIRRELDPPENCLVTLTAVETTPDLMEARVWLSVLPESETEHVFKFLNQKKREIQNLLHKKLVMKPLPKLVFKSDATEANASRIEQLLDNLS